MPSSYDRMQRTLGQLGHGQMSMQQGMDAARQTTQKLNSGATWNQQGQELDVWGNPVGQPATAQATPPANNQQAAAPPAPPQKQYGGVVGGYGSGDPVTTTAPAAQNTTTPPAAATPFAPITIASGGQYTGPRNDAPIYNKFSGFQITEDMLSGVPETDVARIREAAAKGPGAFREFMRMSAASPWYATLTSAIMNQINQGGGFLPWATTGYVDPSGGTRQGYNPTKDAEDGSYYQMMLGRSRGY